MSILGRDAEGILGIQCLSKQHTSEHGSHAGGGGLFVTALRCDKLRESIWKIWWQFNSVNLYQLNNKTLKFAFCMSFSKRFIFLLVYVHCILLKDQSATDRGEWNGPSPVLHEKHCFRECSLCPARLHICIQFHQDILSRLCSTLLNWPNGECLWGSPPHCFLKKSQII